MCVLLALPAFLYAASDIGKKIALLSIIFFLCNSFVYFYSQEVRSYGLLLALSVWSTILFLANERRIFFIVLSALSLTHFFGTILACVILFWVIIEKRNCPTQRNASIFVFLIAAAWPIVWFLSGSAQNLTGGNFWIQTSPLGSAIDALKAGSPVIFFNLLAISKLFSDNYYVFLATLALICLSLLAFICISALKSCPKERVIVAKLIYVIFGITAAVAIISFDTPISTTRNYMIVVPAISILLAFAAVFLTRIFRTKFSAAVQSAILAGFVALSAHHTYQLMMSRFAPAQDWRQVAHQVEEFMNSHPDYQTFVYKKAPRNREFFEERASFYFSKDTNLELITFDDLAQTPDNSIIVFGNVRNTSSQDQECQNEITDKFEELNRNFIAWFTEQYLSCWNGYVVLESSE